MARHPTMKSEPLHPPALTTFPLKHEHEFRFEDGYAPSLSRATSELDDEAHISDYAQMKIEPLHDPDLTLNHMKQDPELLSSTPLVIVQHPTKAHRIIGPCDSLEDLRARKRQREEGISPRPMKQITAVRFWLLSDESHGPDSPELGGTAPEVSHEPKRKPSPRNDVYHPVALYRGYPMLLDPLTGPQLNLRPVLENVDPGRPRTPPGMYRCASIPPKRGFHRRWMALKAAVRYWDDLDAWFEPEKEERWGEADDWSKPEENGENYLREVADWFEPPDSMIQWVSTEDNESDDSEGTIWRNGFSQRSEEEGDDEDDDADADDWFPEVGDFDVIRAVKLDDYFGILPEDFTEDSCYYPDGTKDDEREPDWFTKDPKIMQKYEDFVKMHAELDQLERLFKEVRGS